MTETETDNSPRCRNGHEVDPGSAFCAACGAQVTTPQPLPSPGWYPDESSPTLLLRWWDGTTWTGQTQPGSQSLTATPASTRRRLLPVALTLAGGLTVLVVALIVIAVSRSDHGNDRSSRGGASTSAAMYDSSAAQQDVISSIRHDFCTGYSSPNPNPGSGFVYISCQGPSRNGNALFQVYASPEALQLALNSGAISCMNGMTAVLGPTWAANVLNASDAASLVARGATPGSCN